MASYSNKFRDISSADEHVDNCKSDNEHTEVLKLFDSEAECDASFSGFEDIVAKPTVKSSVKKVCTGPGKGQGNNLKKKAPAKKRKAPTPSSSSPLKNKKPKKASENHESSDMSGCYDARIF